MPRIQSRTSMSQKQRACASELHGLPSPECRLRLTFDKSPVRESRTPGSVRGAGSNPRLYRDRCNQSGNPALCKASVHLAKICVLRKDAKSARPDMRKAGFRWHISLMSFRPWSTRPASTRVAPAARGAGSLPRRNAGQTRVRLVSRQRPWPLWVTLRGSLDLVNPNSRSIVGKPLNDRKCALIVKHGDLFFPLSGA